VRACVWVGGWVGECMRARAQQLAPQQQTRLQMVKITNVARIGLVHRTYQSFQVLYCFFVILLHVVLFTPNKRAYFFDQYWRIRYTKQNGYHIQKVRI
jgi:hypothetical protein